MPVQQLRITGVIEQLRMDILNSPDYSLPWNQDLWVQVMPKFYVDFIPALEPEPIPIPYAYASFHIN